MKTLKIIIGVLMGVFLFYSAPAFTDETDTIEGNQTDLPRFEMEPVTVTGKIIESQVLPTSKEMLSPGKAIKRRELVDFADLLSSELIEVNMIRKGGYGNEVSLRGFAQAELRTTINGSILEGGCGSRKDPALSLVGLLTIDRIDIQQGPFDVTVPGALGGTVKLTSKKPSRGFHGEILGKYGSFGFPSGGINLHGGSDRFRAMAGYNYAESDQYEDGSGNALYYFREGTGRPYNTDGKTIKAFEKEDAWIKFEMNPAENQTIRFEHAYGFGDDILTPRAGMDVDEETTHLSNFSYDMQNLGKYSERLTLSVFRNDVEHIPFDDYRELVGNPQFHRHNEVESIITGAKIENVLSVNAMYFTIGMDGYGRRWDGDMFRDDTGEKMTDLIPDVDIRNIAGYVKFDSNIHSWDFGAGLRFDHMQTEANADLTQSSKVTSTNKVTDDLINGYLYTRFQVSNSVSLFTGLGRSARFPTGVERYLQSPSPLFHGNPDLKPTFNTEFDAGFEIKNDRLAVTVKGMYSDLENYIYQKGKQTEESHQSWTNIDAHLWGGDISGVFSLSDSFNLETGIAYYRGKKDSQPDSFNQDEDLANMTPLKSRLGFRFTRDIEIGSAEVTVTALTEWIHSEDSTDVDEDAGEKVLDGWDVGNVRFGLQYKSIDINLGIENIFDEEYAVANSYEWDVVAGEGSNPSIVNEPGRSFFISMGFMF